MTDMKPWAFELEEYIREGEPDRARRAELWQVAIGLQDVDGLTPSQYLLDTAKEHIEGELSIDQVQSRIAAYYQQRDERTQAELESEEADVVSSRIAEILGERAFTFSPSELKSIHGRLFKGLLKEAGAYRRYNITKNEWVLKGDTVRYSSWNIVPETLEYDFEKEGAFSYQGLSKLEVTRHIAAFASGIWQIHPFCEGNTRTTAVFIIKYLNAMGLEIGNGPFADHSWYFRNALVRANYTNLDQDVHETNRYLEAFFENALLGASHDLKNRYLHIDWVGDVNATGDGEMHIPQVAPQVTPQVLRLLDVLGDKELSLRQIAEALGLSDRKNIMRNYVVPALDSGRVVRPVPDKPHSRFQKYRKA